MTRPKRTLKDIVDPRKQAFAKYYLDPESPTFSNALQSAIKAGFKRSYACNITRLGSTWMEVIIRGKEMLDDAENALASTLKENTDTNDNRHRVKIDAAKFVASRLGKERWSERTETDVKVTGGIAHVELTPEMLQAKREYEDKMKKLLT